MRIRTTPLGFLPGEIALHSHCMFIYAKRDDAFVRSIADFLSAGIVTGEMSMCVIDNPAREKITARMLELGAEAECRSGQLRINDISDVYTADGRLNTSRAVDCWQRTISEASDRWQGVRVFGDVGGIPLDRLARLKLLEYESSANIGFPFNIALCGYQSGSTPRSLLLQIKTVHPFIANSRSIRKNPAFLDTPRFLTGFYRFRRVSREYPAVLQYASVAQEDFEEIAARTPLSLPGIAEVKAALADVFPTIAGRAGCRPNTGPTHMHVIFTAQTDAFVISIWYHSPQHEGEGSEMLAGVGLGHDEFRSASELMDEIYVERLGDDTLVTMSKRYAPP